MDRNKIAMCGMLPDDYAIKPNGKIWVSESHRQRIESGESNALLMSPMVDWSNPSDEE